MDSFITMKCPSLSLVKIGVLKINWSDTTVAPPTLLWLLFHVTSIIVLFLSTSLCQNVKSVLIRQHIVESCLFFMCLKFQLGSLYLLIPRFNPVTFNVIIDMVEFVSTVLLFIFLYLSCLFFKFSLCFIFFVC